VHAIDPEKETEERIMEIDLSELRGWAREGGAIARGYFQNTAGRRKADRSWVTEGDIEVERILVQRISARYPDHGIIGEEKARHALKQEFVWAIDPIDGTACFVAGLPSWGVSIGLLRHGIPYLGVFYMPISDEIYWSVPGGGAFFNDTPIHVAGPGEWDNESWISVPSNSHRRYTINFSGKVRSLGSTVADLCFVARGSATGTLLTRCAIWDLAAGLSILREAGGMYIGLSGQMPDLPAMAQDGSLLPEPLLAAGPDHLDRLRAVIGLRH
jgi:myo-inositol-1(or 4)-monophosphatase